LITAKREAAVLRTAVKAAEARHDTAADHAAAIDAVENVNAALKEALAEAGRNHAEAARALGDQLAQLQNALAQEQTGHADAVNQIGTLREALGREQSNRADAVRRLEALAVSQQETVATAEAQAEQREREASHAADELNHLRNAFLELEKTARDRTADLTAEIRQLSEALLRSRRIQRALTAAMAISQPVPAAWAFEPKGGWLGAILRRIGLRAGPDIGISVAPPR
jgi:chromosome segregation ATPase